MRAPTVLVPLAMFVATCSQSPAPDAGVPDGATDARDVDACRGQICAGTCIDVTVDVHHCGSCTIDCTNLPGVDGSRVACRSGRCDVTGACVAGRAHCSADTTSGCETDITTVAHCGACDQPCAAPPNGTPTCTSGTCQLSCASGFTVMGSVCVSSSDARPISPPNGSVVSSHQPTLRWALSGGRDGAHVELCRDRDCTMSIAALDVTGTSTQPPSRLSPGVVFWRLHARTGTVADADPSPTWSFTVPPRSASTDTAWGQALADIDGDGFDDVIVGASGATSGVGRAYLFRGSASGLSSTPAGHVDGERAGAGFFGTALDIAGDTDHDGFADVLVSTPALTGSSGIVQVFAGSNSGLGASASWTYAATTGPDSFLGAHLAAAGDVNGDGIADVLVASRGADPHPGLVYLFDGSALGPSPMPDATLVAPSGVAGTFGASLASAGDVNGDGFVDAIVGAPASGSPGRAYVFLGAPTGFVSPPVATLSSSDVSEVSFGTTVAGLGDIDGDGYADVAVGATDTSAQPGHVYVHLGSATGPASTAAVALSGPDGAGGLFGYALVSAGDVNGDGRADLAVSATGVNMQAGRVYVYLSQGGTYRAAPDVVLSGTAGSGEQFGYALACANDVNGDGHADLVVGSLGGATRAGRVYLFLGGAIGLSTSPQVVIDGTDGTSGFFGRSVAIRRPPRRNHGARVVARALAAATSARIASAMYAPNRRVPPGP